MSQSTIVTAPLPDLQALDARRRYWKSWELIVFRIAFIFYFLLVVPLSWKWYERVFTSKIVFDFFNSFMGFRGNDFFKVDSESGKWGVASYANWFGIFLIAVIAGFIWTAIDRRYWKRKEYNFLNYWLGLVIRYRVALGIIVFGFMKFYPVQMPYPGLGSLHTNFGDFSAYKLYWHSVGLVPWYEVVLGVAEVTAGILMLFRRTLFIGAVLNLGILYNIAHANHAYDGGVHVYSAETVILSLFFIVQYTPDIWRLLIKEQDVTPGRYFPAYAHAWQRRLATTAKVLSILLFVFYYGYLRYELHFIKKETKAPVTQGLRAIAGHYNVTSFSLNGTEIPYHPLDSVRWQDVVFEEYSTMVFKVNRPKVLPLSNGSRQEHDIDRNYELSGIAGSTFLYYDQDTGRQVLTLYDKGVIKKKDSGEREKNRGKDPKKGRVPDWILHYARPDASTVLLSGTNAAKDSVVVVLNKLPKQYPIQQTPFKSR